MINYCSGLLKEIMSEQKFVDTSKFEMNINIPTDAPTFPILSIRNYVGIISILAYPLVAYKITSNIHSDYYSIMIMMMGIVHFTPFFLKKAGKKTRIEWIVIALSINLGIIANISFFNFIIANIAFLVYVLKIRQNIKYFSALQYFLMTATINTILIFKEVGTPESIEIFCETHTLALVFYLALTLFLTLVLLNPPKIFIKNVELSKTIIPFIGACYLLISLMLIEEANTAPGFLRETYQSFHQNLKIFNSLIVLVTIEFIVLVKLINYCDHRFENIPKYLDIPESSQVELAFLAMKNYNDKDIQNDSIKFFKDRYFTNVMLKFADITLVFSALVINIIFTEGGWYKPILFLYIFGLIYTGKQFVLFIRKLNIIFFTMEAFLTFIIPSYLVPSKFQANIKNSILDSLYYIFGSPFLKAAVLHFKSRSFTPVASNLMNLPTISASNIIEEDDPNWKSNWIVFFLVVIPMNILSVYLESLKNVRSVQKRIHKRNWEFVVETLTIILIWVIIYVQLVDSVFFLVLSSYVEFL